MPVPMPNGTRGPAPNPPPSPANIAAAHKNLHNAAAGLVKLGNPSTRKNRKNRKTRKQRKTRNNRRN